MRTSKALKEVYAKLELRRTKHYKQLLALAGKLKKEDQQLRRLKVQIRKARIEERDPYRHVPHCRPTSPPLVGS